MADLKNSEFSGSPLSEVGAMTVEEAARYLRISRTSLFSLFKSKALTPARIAGRTLVRRVDADALLKRAVEN